MHDPSTIGFMLAPELFSGYRARVSVETEVGEQFGQTRPRKMESGPHTWISHADADGFFDLLVNLMERA